MRKAFPREGRRADEEIDSRARVAQGRRKNYITPGPTRTHEHRSEGSGRTSDRAGKTVARAASNGDPLGKCPITSTGKNGLATRRSSARIRFSLSARDAEGVGSTGQGPGPRVFGATSNTAISGGREHRSQQ